MGLTAFLPTGAPQVLSFIGTPGAGTVGHALVWSQSPQGFTLSPISVGPDQFSGVLPVASGGTGSNNGSIATTGNLSFSTDSPNKVLVSPFLRTDVTSREGSQTGIEAFLASSENNSRQGIFLNKQVIEEPGVTPGLAFAAMYNGTTVNNAFIPVFAGKSFGLIETPALNFIGFQHPAQTNSVPVITFDFRRGAPTGSSPLNESGIGIQFTNRAQARWTMLGNGNISQVGTLTLTNTTESTSETTGALQLNGGLGVAKNVNTGGNLKVSGSAINFVNLPTSSASLAVGDLWRDGELVKVKI